MDPYETFCLTILSKFLFEGPGSPFYQAILVSGIAPSFCPGIGYDSSTNQSTFVIGVSNVHSDTKNADILKVIKDTLNEVSSLDFSNS